MRDSILHGLCIKETLASKDLGRRSKDSFYYLSQKKESRPLPLEWSAASLRSSLGKIWRLNLATWPTRSQRHFEAAASEKEVEFCCLLIARKNNWSMSRILFAPSPHSRTCEAAISMIRSARGWPRPRTASNISRPLYKDCSIAFVHSSSILKIHA